MNDWHRLLCMLMQEPWLRQFVVIVKILVPGFRFTFESFAICDCHGSDFEGVSGWFASKLLYADD